MLSCMRKVLTIAGSDSGGGAGIQADLKTFAAHGCYGMSAITAVTVQNTLGARRVFPMPADLIEEQIGSVLSDLGADAIKIGMLFDAEAVFAVERALSGYKGPVVLDPVMQAKGGARLTKSGVPLRRLFPTALLVTPNAVEADQLGDIQAKNILFKGGHSKMPDRLVLENGETHEFAMEWIDTPNTHGTGCTYASAIAANLALGAPLLEAVRLAKAYLHGAIVSGSSMKIGSGHGPVHHFWRSPCGS